MDKQNLNQVSRALLAAWDKSVERALDDTARTEALTEPQLNNVAGMRVESGLRGGGLWAPQSMIHAPVVFPAFIVEVRTPI